MYGKGSRSAGSKLLPLARGGGLPERANRRGCCVQDLSSLARGGGLPERANRRGCCVQDLSSLARGGGLPERANRRGCIGLRAKNNVPHFQTPRFGNGKSKIIFQNSIKELNTTFEHLIKIRYA